ncbi:hypothetical protein MESMUL_16980 [Mesosutterella multiformis]|uniref:Uncharacterized protein n=1 Tax=Mesosutterella multiformis TaxID=2259133 RepID=A0A388SI19_9BURK|nr:hypothetical protein [Mesosutterella multiformis]GBO94344.1 hypothetical protein MESMUL_16980 [Mesosutterella multiformis]
MLDLGNSAGQLALALNGKLLQPAQGSDGTIFPVIRRTSRIKTSPDRGEADEGRRGTEDHTVGIFSLPDWQVQRRVR